MAGEERSINSAWSREQDRAFENALAAYPEDWERITAVVEGKSVEEVKRHYEILVEDLENIEAGRVPLPNGWDDDVGSSRKGREGRGARSEERRKGIAWTEEEHRLFLAGLKQYGKGDWRSISRNFVISRTPTQVASHAQKYFNRQTSTNKDRRRSSIHDITSVGNTDISTPEGPITGQRTTPPMTPRKSGPTSTPVVGMYGPTIGQPVGAPLGSAVGTPIPSSPHMAYGMRFPVGGSVVPGAPVQLMQMKYPLPHVPTHR